MSDFWNTRYAEPGFAYGTEPNRFFESELNALAPGRLLLPCEGEGRNAVHAARLGWQVDAFDQSAEGRMKCLRLADESGVAVDYALSDVLEFDYGLARYDAIALIFAHFPPVLRGTVHRKCLAALKPGGRLILEAFSPAQLGKSSGGPQTADLLYTEDMLRADFNPGRILKLDSASVSLDEGPYHRGPAEVIRMVCSAE
jgi:SAM-dependent methyltransferase